MIRSARATCTHPMCVCTSTTILRTHPELSLLQPGAARHVTGAISVCFSLEISACTLLVSSWVNPAKRRTSAPDPPEDAVVVGAEQQGAEAVLEAVVVEGDRERDPARRHKKSTGIRICPSGEHGTRMKASLSSLRLLMRSKPNRLIEWK